MTFCRLFKVKMDFYGKQINTIGRHFWDSEYVSYSAHDMKSLMASQFLN